MVQKIYKFFNGVKQKIKKNPRVFVVGLIGVIGVSLLLTSFAAAGFSISIEAEDGNGATVGTDPLASNGKYLQFGSASSGGGGGLDFPANPAMQQSSVSQWGITWNFDKSYSVGKYANGDWWVVGPVTLTGISPAQGSNTNGANINPVKGQIGYDGDLGTFQSLSFPRNVPAGSSIVKGISRAGGPWLNDSSHRGELQTAAVLTVVASPPPKNGAIAFRPPYFGSSKPQYLTTQLRTNLIPSLPVPPEVKRTPTQYPYSYYVWTLQEAADKFQRLQLDHATGDELNRRTHPVDNMSDYGGKFARDIDNAVARLMLNDPMSDKAQAIINVVQYGIDLNEMYKGDAYICADRWHNNCGGHGGGRGLGLLFAATLLNSNDIKNTLDIKQNGIAENYTLKYGHPETPLWGDTTCTVDEYYARFNGGPGPGSKSCQDPYGYIDGGQSPGTGYQGIVTPNWRGTALFMRLVPESQSYWPSVQKDKLLQYIDRATDFGAWAKPDPYNRSFSRHGDKTYINSSTYISPLTESLWINQNLSQKITTDWSKL